MTVEENNRLSCYNAFCQRVGCGQKAGRHQISDKGNTVMERQLGQHISKTGGFVGCSQYAMDRIYQNQVHEGRISGSATGSWLLKAH